MKIIIDKLSIHALRLHKKCGGDVTVTNKNIISLRACTPHADNCLKDGERVVIAHKDLQGIINTIRKEGFAVIDHNPEAKDAGSSRDDIYEMWNQRVGRQKTVSQERFVKHFKPAKKYKVGDGWYGYVFQYSNYYHEEVLFGMALHYKSDTVVVFE